MSAGYQLQLFSRTKSKAEELLAKGATWAESPTTLAKSCDVIFSIVSTPVDVAEIYLGQHGLITHGKPGQLLIDMTTSKPSLAAELSQQAKSKDLHMLDAPVSGGDIGAKEARLSIMVGGSEETFKIANPLFQILGKTIVYQGPAGSGQHTKMVNQTLIATGMIGVCEALLYAHKAGLNLETVLQSVGSGAAGSWSLTNYAPRIMANNFGPGFYIDHFVKDMGIVLEESRNMKLSLPGLALAEQLYISLQAQGEGRSGIQALQLCLSRLAGFDWPTRSTKAT